MIPILKHIFRKGIQSEKRRIIAITPDPTMVDKTVQQHHKDILTLMGRALCIRQIDAASCNGCELEINALNNPYYNIEGLGIKFVASPRHADMLLVTGPVSKNMQDALKIAYECTPNPKLVVATGDCACNGGIFSECGENYAVCGGVATVIPVNVAIPGCPPSPEKLLQGIVTAISDIDTAHSKFQS